MAADDGSLLFKIGIDEGQLKLQVQDINHDFQTIVNGAQNAGKSVDSSFSSGTSAASNSFKHLNTDVNTEMSGINSTLSQFKGLVIGYFSVDALKNFVSQIINVRGQLESLQVIFENIAGTEKGGKLFRDIKDWTFTTPMQITDTTRAGQTLLAFGTDVSNVMPIIKELGDIATGDSERFSALTLAYAQMSSAGKLMGQDLLQMVNAGFNPLQVISEKTGKSMSELRKEMQAGAISSKMVQDAFADAAAKGGKFYGTMDKISGKIKGQMSNLKDAVTRQLDSIGSSNEGIISKGISSVRYLVDNFDELGHIIIGLAATYGTYRAAAMLVTTINSLQASGIGALTIAERLHYAAIVMTEKAQSLLNKTMLANPYVAAATAIAALSAALITSANDADKADSGIKAYKKSLDAATKAEQEHKEKIDNLISVAEDEQASTDDRRKALVRLETAYPGIFKKYKTEEDMLRNILKIKRDIAAEDDLRAGTKAKQDLSSINRKIAKERKAISEAATHGGGQSVLSMRNQLNADLKQQALMQKNYNEKQREQTMAHLGGYSTTRLENEIAVRKRVLKRIEDSQKLGGSIKSGRIVNGIAAGDKTVGQLQEEIQAMSRVINTRKTARTTYRSESGKALSEWKKAVRNYNKLKDSATATTDQVQAAMKNVTEKSTAYKEITGITPENLTKKETAASKHAQTEAEKRQKAAQRASDKAAAQYNAAQESAKKIRQLSDQTRQEISQSEVDIQATTVSNMEEGLQKELAQIDLNYKKAITEIYNKRTKWIAEMQKTMDLQFEKANPNWKKQKLTHPVATFNDLTEEQKSILSTETTQAATTKNVGTANVYKTLLTQYANYEQQRQNIYKKFEKDRLALRTATDKDGNKLSAAALAAYQAELDRQEKQAIKQVNDAEISQAYKDNNLFVKLFGDTSRESVAEIQKIIDKVRELLMFLEAPKDINGNAIINVKSGKTLSKEDIEKATGLAGNELDTISKDPEKLKAISSALKQLLGELSQKGPFELFKANIEDAINTIKKGDTNSIGEGITKIGDAMSQITPQLEKFGNSIAQIFDKGSDKGGRMADQINTVVNILGSVGTSAKGVGEIMSGDVVDGIADTVNGIGNLFSMANSAAKRHKEALKAIMNEEIAQQREYNQLLVEQNLEYEKGTTIFGTDTYGKAANAVTQYGKISKDLLSAESQLRDISIVTGHKKTGLFGWGKGKDVYSTLLSQYPELIDAAGNFNDKLAESVLNTRKMSDEDKATLQNAIDLYKEQKDALTQMRDYLSGIFGDLGNNITNILDAAFKHGTNAAQKMTDSISDMLSKLAEQMVYDIAFEPAIEEAQKQIEAVMENTGLGDKDKFAKETAILQTLFASLAGNEQQGLDLMAELKKIGAEYGFNLFSDTSRSAATSSAVNASQDSVDELTGRATAIQEYSKKSSDSLLLLVSASNQALNHLAGIHENTVSIDDRIDKMQVDIVTMRKGIERINDYGIDLKK